MNQKPSERIKEIYKSKGVIQQTQIDETTHAKKEEFKKEYMENYHSFMGGYSPNPEKWADWWEKKLLEMYEQGKKDGVEETIENILNKVPIPPNWEKCQKIYNPHGKHDSCALCGFSPEGLEKIITSLKERE